MARPQPTGRLRAAERPRERRHPEGLRPAPGPEGSQPARRIAAPSTRVDAASAPRDGRPPEPEVLVPPGETEALLRFVALVHRERMAPALFGAAGEPSAELAELAAIDIQPLEIVPLDPAETSGT